MVYLVRTVDVAYMLISICRKIGRNDASKNAFSTFLYLRDTPRGSRRTVKKKVKVTHEVMKRTIRNMKRKRNREECIWEREDLSHGPLLMDFLCLLDPSARISPLHFLVSLSSLAVVRLLVVAHSTTMIGDMFCGFV